MRYKFILIMLAISIILSGCIDIGKKDNTAEKLVPGKIVKASYVDKSTILNGEDFPDFKLVDNVYYIAPENLSLTLETEIGHSVYEMNSSVEILPGYRIYGDSELYNSSKGSRERYILIQYKVFDNNESLSDTISATAEKVYIQHGYKYVPMNNTNNRNIVILESGATNHTDTNVTIILFGFDTVVGKIGVQDSKEKSLNESLKILDIVFDRIHVQTKEVKAARLNLIRSMSNEINRSDKQNESSISNISNSQDISNTLNVLNRSNVSN